MAIAFVPSGIFAALRFRISNRRKLSFSSIVRAFSLSRLADSPSDSGWLQIDWTNALRTSPRRPPQGAAMDIDPNVLSLIQPIPLGLPWVLFTPAAFYPARMGAPYGRFPMRSERFLPVKVIIPQRPVDNLDLHPVLAAAPIDLSGCFIRVSIVLINRYSSRME
jgi:hypothetical protein